MAGKALYDVGLRLRAAELHDMGRGRASIAALLGIPEETVRKWLDIYRSAGIEVLAMMGKKHAAYSFETKLAAVRAVVDEGHDEARGHGEVRDSLAELSQEMAEGIQGGRPGGAQAEAQGGGRKAPAPRPRR